MKHKNFLKLFLILILGLATTVLIFNACGDEEPKQEQTDANQPGDSGEPSDPKEPNEPDDPNKPVETAGFKVGAYNTVTKQFTNEAVNFNTAFTFAIEVKDGKFKAALDAAPTGQGGTARTLAFFEARYHLTGSTDTIAFTAPSNEERLTRVPGTYIFYKENYRTNKTLAAGATGTIHYQVLVAEIGSAYWWEESNVAGTIDYAGGIPFAVPNPGGTIDVTGVSLNTSSVSLSVGGSQTLQATVTPSNATNKTVTWTSSNSSVATVSNGLVTARQAGTATITAKAGNVTATCTVSVTANNVAVTGVSLNQTSFILLKGETQTLVATVLPANATNKTVTWTSSNNGVATVSNGTVTAVSAGTATITANASGRTATCTVTVNNSNSNDPYTDPGVIINGIKWATRNVNTPGTFVANPEDYGMLYQWNRAVGWSSTDPVTSSPSGIPWEINSDWNGNGAMTWESTNNVCPAGWRVPTQAELQKLLEAITDSKWTFIDGKVIFENGRTFGSGSNTIFLPFAGFRGDSDHFGSTLQNSGSIGIYWSSTPVVESRNSVYALFFTVEQNGVGGRGSYIDNAVRYYGYSVRCVAQ